MESILTRPIFLFIAIGYLIYFGCKHMDIAMHPIIRNYWADFCCLFIVNSISLSIMRVVKRNYTLELSRAQLVFSLLLCALLFEIILPRFNESYTSDVWDVVAYFFGLFLFYFWRKRDASHLKY